MKQKTPAPKAKHSPSLRVLPGSWELLRPSIQLVRQNIDTMLWLVIIPAVLSLLAGVLAQPILQRHIGSLPAQASDALIRQALHATLHDLATTTPGRLAVLLASLGFVWSALVFPATITFAVRAVRGEVADVASSLREGFGKFWRLYGISIIIVIATLVGLALLIVPGLFIIRRYLLAPFYVADQNLTIRQALTKCAQESKPVAGYIWGTIAVYIVFNFTSSLLNTIPYIGFIFSVIVGYAYYFAFALRYLSLQNAKQPLASSIK